MISVEITGSSVELKTVGFPGGINEKSEKLNLFLRVEKIFGINFISFLLVYEKKIQHNVKLFFYFDEIN